MKLSCRVQFASIKLQENGVTQLPLLSALSQYDGIWTNKVLRGVLSSENLQTEQGEFLGWFQSSLTISSGFSFITRCVVVNH